MSFNSKYTGAQVENWIEEVQNRLPLSGGTISNNTRNLLLIKNTDSTGNSTLWLGGDFNTFSSGATVDYGSDGGLYLSNFKAYANNNKGISCFRITSDNKIQCGDANWSYNVYDMLHSGNYNSYSPTLTGAGASGTWGISITGNAATATKLQTARTLWGQSFDGTANVSGALTGVTDLTASGTIRWNGSDGRYTTYSQDIVYHIQDRHGWAGGLTWKGTDGTTYNHMGHYEDYVYFGPGTYGTPTNYILDSNGYMGLGIRPTVRLHVAGDIVATGGISQSSDERNKNIIENVELSLEQIANAPLLKYYYKTDEGRITHVGSIAQYWASLNDWFCKLDNKGFYTMEIQNAALASAISIAREFKKYKEETESTISSMKKEIQELKQIILNMNK